VTRDKMSATIVVVVGGATVAPRVPATVVTIHKTIVPACAMDRVSLVRSGGGAGGGLCTITDLLCFLV
jgi:hypothetical protein